LNLKSQFDELGKLVSESNQILVLSPDHMDGDSLATMLALEEILGDLGKQVTMHATGRVEDYLKHLPGWDRVGDEWPSSYDLAILVDTGAPSSAPRLLELHHTELSRKPWVIIDHHLNRTPFEGATMEIVDSQVASSSELVYRATLHLGWALNPRACRLMVNSILADSLNLTNSLATPTTVEAFADLVKRGDLNLAEIHRAYRDTSAFEAKHLFIKGQLLQSLELHADGRIAIITVPQALLKQYRDEVNPAALVFPDMLWAKGVEVAVIINDYPQVVRTSLRSRGPVAGPVATRLGGGGHPAAAAFPMEGKTAEEVKEALIPVILEELDRNRQ
jgi:phosphoesterase RecJ-like protein